MRSTTSCDQKSLDDLRTGSEKLRMAEVTRFFSTDAEGPMRTGLVVYFLKFKIPLSESNAMSE